ncbi:MAG: tRNA glutamyl-Q(34) synthetase GluQRS [Acidimicrobiales bacterium]|nr:MAG: tRNA glutamyl-Q(34) synthetase GluQRS [Acidimicrobiales bacterium]
MGVLPARDHWIGRGIGPDHRPSLIAVAVGRYAPSPTGDLHVGNLRTALLAWLFAHHDGDALLLRMDDLDPATSSLEHECRQLDDLAALGVTFDGPILRQSERTGAYGDAIGQLEDLDLTYPCFCSRREIREAASAPHVHLPDGAYPGTCAALSTAERAHKAESRPAALRVRAKGIEVSFTDRVYGPHEIVVDDFVVRRNDGVAAYNLASVVDDATQGVEEVVRGADLLDGTPRQIWLRDTLGLPPVEHAHVPLMVNAAGHRLAKRDGAVTRTELLDLGWTDAILVERLLLSVGITASTLTDATATFEPAALPTEPTVWSAEDR